MEQTVLNMRIVLIAVLMIGYVLMFCAIWKMKLKDYAKFSNGLGFLGIFYGLKFGLLTADWGADFLFFFFLQGAILNLMPSQWQRLRARPR